MKNLLGSITVLMLFAVLAGALSAQPQYYNYNTQGSSNSFPFNIPAGKEVQLLYLPGDFTQPTPAPAGYITSLSFLISSYPLGPWTYTDLTIKLGLSSITSFDGTGFYAGPLTTVYYRPSVSLSASAGSWMTLVLDTPFLYNPASSLIVEVGQCGAPGATGYSLVFTTLSDSRRNYSTGGCPFSYMNSNSAAYHIGFDIQPVPVAAVTPGSLTQSLYSQGTATQNLTITNSGNAPLNYNIGISYTYPDKPVNPGENGTQGDRIASYQADPGKIQASTTGGTNFIPDFGRSTVYYNQTANPTTNGYASQEFGDYTEYSCAGADDFTVPDGATWNIRHVYAGGTFGGIGGTIVPFVNVIFYQDASGYPGTPVATFTAIPSISDALGNVNVYLPGTVTLTTGHYWVSVAAAMDYTTNGQWYWITQLPPIIQNEMVWQNPGGGFGGCTSWCYGSVQWPSATDFNFTFALSDATWVPWLTAAPITGTVPANSSMDVMVTFDATRLNPDNYNAQVTVNSDDPVNPAINVPATLNVLPPSLLPFSEDWSSGSLLTQGWTTTEASSHWKIIPSSGNPMPAVIFDWTPILTNYESSMISKTFDATGITDNITLKFDLGLNNFSTSTLEELAVDVWDGSSWNTVKNYTNAGGSFTWASESVNITPFAIGRVFNVRFRAHGLNSFNINFWILDNIKIAREVLGVIPAALTLTIPKGKISTRDATIFNNGVVNMYWRSSVQSNVQTAPAKGSDNNFLLLTGVSLTEHPPSVASMQNTVTRPFAGLPLNKTGSGTGTIMSSSPSINKYVPDFGRATIYYNQTGAPSSEGAIASQTFIDFPSYTCKGADDFLVPGGSTWDIRHVFLGGAFFNGGFEVPAMDIKFYTENGGAPGSVLYTFTNIPVNSDITGNVDVYLPSPVTLTAGHYWVSAAAVMDFGTHGQWAWAKQLAPVILNQFEWQNDLGGFGYGCTIPTWCLASTIWGGVDNNLSFALSNSTQMITISPNQGPLSANSSQDLSVIFDATFLNVGQYNASVTFSAEANVFPVVVPVTVNVVQVDDIVDIPTTTISSGTSSCFNALQTLTVGGSGGTFSVMTGGSATLIAGHNVRLLYGTKVYPGGNLWGYIATNNEYCNVAKGPEIPGSPEKSAEIVPVTESSIFNVYPNPTTGSFSLKLSSEPGKTPVMVKCYNLMGSMIMEKEIYSGMTHEFTLADQKTGIYLIRVVQNGEIGIKKIIRQ